MIRIIIGQKDACYACYVSVETDSVLFCLCRLALPCYVGIHFHASVIGRYLSVTPFDQLWRQLDMSTIILLLLMSKCTIEEELVLNDHLKI